MAWLAEWCADALESSRSKGLRELLGVKNNLFKFCCWSKFNLLCSDHGVSVSFVSSQQRSQAEAVCHDKVERDIRNRSQLDLQITRY